MKTLEVKIVEIKILVYCLKDIPQESALEEISKLVDSALVSGGQATLHYENKFKAYSFSNLFPLEKEKVYLKGNIYSVTLRTASSEVTECLLKNLHNQYTISLKALSSESRTIPYKPLEKIFSLTPIVIKTEEGYWRTKYNVDFFEKRLRENLIKKYNFLNHTSMNEDFELFKVIKIENKKPIAMKYKGITLLGDKITLEIEDNEEAQKLAYMALGTGLGELSARGAGFVQFRYV